MLSLTLHDVASGLAAQMIGVECQHCIRRGLFTAEALQARRGGTRTLEQAGVRCGNCGSRRFTATRFITRSAAHAFMRNL